MFIKLVEHKPFERYFPNGLLIGERLYSKSKIINRTSFPCEFITSLVDQNYEDREGKVFWVVLGVIAGAVIFTIIYLITTSVF